MTIDLPIVQGAYLQDIMAQPKAIADTLGGLAQRPVGRLSGALERCSRVVLTGMGSSLHGLHPLQIDLVRSGQTSVIVETAELLHAQSGWVDERSLVIAVSQSGASAETVLLLDEVARRAVTRRPMVVGVTNTADSPLGRRADEVVEVRAGAEAAVSCKTYLGTLVALEWLGDALLGRDLGHTFHELGGIASAVKGYLARGGDHVRELMTTLRDIRHLFITGRGTSLAAVGTAGLTLKESTHFHSEGMSVPAFRHGPFEMTSPGLFAVVFAGAEPTLGLNAKLVRDIIGVGGRAVLVGEDTPGGVFRLPKVPARARPVVEILPIQMMSLAMAANAGRTPGVFERATKVTSEA